MSSASPSGPLRICLVSEEFPPETGWGGIGTYTYEIAAGFAELGHRVHVLARTWGPERTDAVGAVQVHRLRSREPRWRRGTRALTWRLRESREIAQWNRRICDALDGIQREEGLDVLEAPEYHAQALLAGLRRRRRPPLVVRLHTPAYLNRRHTGVHVGGTRLDAAIAERLERALARRAAVVTAPSRDLADDVASAWNLRADEVRVIPNPIGEFDVPASGDGRTVLYVGRVSSRKGVDTLIEAMPAILDAVPDARLRLVGRDHPSAPGGGSMSDHLRARANELDVPAEAVQLCGPRERSQLAQEYATAAVCVVPSRYESFGYACVEAMAAGRALVASDAGGIPEVVTDGVDGVLVAPGDAAALAAAVSELLRDEARRERLGAHAQLSVAERFSRAAVSASTVALYREVLAEAAA